MSPLQRFIADNREQAASEREHATRRKVLLEVADGSWKDLLEEEIRHHESLATLLDELADFAEARQ